MLFDAHARAFEAFGGVPQRGIYDNMKTAVDQVLAGKKRKINARFEAMTGHYLFEPEFCNVASGWEKGIVEKNVRDRRTSIWHRAKDRRWADWSELNAWLAEQSKAAWVELNHPEYPAMKVADVLQDEQTQLMPVPRPFDGYVELLARVSSTSLIHLERNRYSVPTEHANSVVSLRIYHDHIAAVADGVRVAAHRRCFDRSQTFYDWQHYISLLERKPGGLRNGAPFETMPAAFKQLQAILMRRSGGDAVMAQVLAAVPVHGLEAVLVAAELALESGKPSGEHVLNVLAVSIKLLAFSGSIFKLSKGIVQLLLAIVELPLNLSKFTLDFRLGSRISQDALQLITNRFNLSPEGPLSIKVLSNAFQNLQLLLWICFAGVNIIQIIANFA